VSAGDPWGDTSTWYATGAAGPVMTGEELTAAREERVRELAYRQAIAELAGARLSIAHLEEVLGERDDLLSRLEAVTHRPAELTIADMERKAGQYKAPG
jgi:hypothetical protein